VKLLRLVAVDTNVEGIAVEDGLSGGDEVGGSASVDWGKGTHEQPVWTATGLVGLGAGASGTLGRTNTNVTTIIHGK